MNILILDMDPIRGESALPGYEGKVDLLAYHHGPGDFTITKYLDQASAALLQSSLGGRSHAQADIIIGQLHAGVVTEQLRYTLKDVVVSSISVSGQGDRPVETLSLNCLTLSWEKP